MHAQILPFAVEGWQCVSLYLFFLLCSKVSEHTGIMVMVDCLSKLKRLNRVFVNIKVK